ncbi:response regulator [Eikenella sp. S3360]|uniref:Response regulator n=2 Tax=Eikenella glucosivorans TaxID=2766967 RepID=A0ABS0N726_9NEIS|nr:response regulator [Eikenella glucosivorans]
MNPHILIIEDEREIAELVELSLARARFTARIAPTAGQARQLLAREHFDLLLLDVGLPDTDGFEFLKTLRPQYAQPVIMLTAQDEETDRILGLELGADDYIGKPFSPRELAARVKAVLRRTQTPPAEPAPAPVWHDDAPACCIRHRGRELPLTQGEYRLLRTLLHRPGRVFGREELLAAMFGGNRPSDPHTVNTHIRALRHKLREAGVDGEPIRTHHGLGYSFNGE